MICCLFISILVLDFKLIIVCMIFYGFCWDVFLGWVKWKLRIWWMFLYRDLICGFNLIIFCGEVFKLVIVFVVIFVEVECCLVGVESWLVGVEFFEFCLFEIFWLVVDLFCWFDFWVEGMFCFWFFIFMIW